MPTPRSAARVIFEEAFGEMVRAGLSARPKNLQPAYFYDALGSALFDAIMRLPEYTITRAETKLLQAHGHEIMRAAGTSLEVVELGPGNGEKLALILATLRRRARPSDRSLCLRARKRAHARAPILRCRGLDLPGQLCRRSGSFPKSKCKRLVLFLGSNIGNFTAGRSSEFPAQCA